MAAKRNKRGEKEYLLVRGRLDRAGRFIAGRCRSTPNVRQWPVTEHSDVTLELLDATGRVMHRELAEVRADTTCEPGDARTFRVQAYIGLREDAASLRLMRGDIQLWEHAIPEQPTLDIRLMARRASRDRPLALRLKFSPPGEQAHLTVIYRWGERQFQPIYIGPPAEKLEFDLAGLPGGEACRLVVSYSNGIRSAHAASDTFVVPKLGPSVDIVQPAARSSVVAGTPLILEAAAHDPELPGGAAAGRLSWQLDGREVADGFIASIDGLEPGRHRLALVYRGSMEVETSVEIRARKSEAVTANEWPEWDFMRE
jgi:hypothetical protein